MSTQGSAPACRLVAIPFMIALLLSFLPVSAPGAETAAPDRLHSWSGKEVDLLRSLWIGSLPPLPRDPSNRYSDNPKARVLGEKLFFDKRFSKNGKVACATCHERDYSFTEDMPRAHGVGSTVRRSPHLIGAGYGSWFFWDGRADSLWSQALGPPENPVEHGIARTFCARLIAEHYRKEYEEIFGPLPSLPGDVCVPIARPAPEDAEAYRAWMSIPPAKADEINRVYANMGKAMAAYVREIRPGPSRFDRYVGALLKGDVKTMRKTFDRKQVEGLRLFIGRAGCVNCHNGPLFTNGEFRVTGVYQPSELPPDRGRIDGIAKVLASEFNCLGRYSDAKESDCLKLKSLDPNAKDALGAFKVPSLRNVAEHPPYMHAGQYWSICEVLRFYSGKMNDANPSPGLPRDGLTEGDMVRLEAFLNTLSAPPIYPGSGKDAREEGGHGHHNH